MIYLDSSALVKLVHPEPDSASLVSWLTAALPKVPAVLSTVFLFDIDAAIRRAAATMTDPLLRSLDALHLATALEFGSELHAFVAYDKRLLAAATAAAGLPTARPNSAS